MNMQAPAVRMAQPEDYSHIIAISEALHAENGHDEIDYPTAEACIMQAINQDKALIGIIGPVGHIQGIVFLRFASFWYSRKVFLEELFLYVPPEHRRGTRNAVTLLRFARDTARRLAVPLVIGVLSNHQTKAKLKLYERILGEPVGGYFFVSPGV